MPKRIAIIGSGVSGLTAIKCCLDEGLVPVCLERTDHVSGLWYYTEEAKDGQSCVMKSTVINTSKEIMAYSDFPIPAEFPVFMHNTKVHEYLKSYGDSFQASKYTRFNTEVLKVTQAENFEETGQWKLQLIDHDSNVTSTEIFDGVLVCTGHHADKHVPKFEGLENFQGKVLHSHDYRHPVGYEDKRILVVGIGNSGSDLLVEFSRIAKQVYLCARRGCWLWNRVGPRGLPGDLFGKRRFVRFIYSLIPRWLRNRLIERSLNAHFDHELYGLKPNHAVDATHPTGGDDLPNIFISGAVIVKPDIRKFGRNTVEFVDGSTVEIDVVLLATGYTFGFPFIDHPSMEVKENQIALYKYIFPPDVKHATMAVIGGFQPLGALMPICELQCRWATRVFKGTTSLPTRDDMWMDIEGKRAAMRSRYVNSPRHTIQVDYTSYMDEIAELIGCRPHIGTIFMKDPRLGLQCLFGPTVPSQYRLLGPHRWDGARETIMTVWDRTLAGISRKSPPPKRQQGSAIMYILAVVIIAIILKLFLWT